MDARKFYSDSPAFFLDCADFFFRNKQPGLGMRILTNIAELRLENPAFLRILAHRLAELGQSDLSVQLFEAVLKMRPEEPQSYRDLALVLAEQKKYKRAMELLNHVVMNQWDRFDEIEVIALMELNRIMPLARENGIKKIPLDPRLIRLLDVDIRIVLTWDADMTDVDLWVTEPSGEKVFYSAPLTEAGGHVSADFTEGYGPEEYVIRRARHGKYLIQADYYGSDSPSLQGPVTVQADVYTNYGRKNEKRQRLTLRLAEKKETFTVGEIEF
jgi:Ca-activated chloride channel homolog